MKPSRRRCEYCGRWYAPDPRTAGQQKACPRPECRLARRRRKQRRWRALNPGCERGQRVTRKVWAKAYPDYYRQYRATHPDYVARDNRRRVEARRRAKVSANVTASRRALVEKASRLGSAPAPEVSANVTAMSRRMAAVEDCLRSTVAVLVSANVTGMAPVARPG